MLFLLRASEQQDIWFDSFVFLGFSFLCVCVLVVFFFNSLSNQWIRFGWKMGDATKLAFAVFLISCSSGGCGELKCCYMCRMQWRPCCFLGGGGCSAMQSSEWGGLCVWKCPSSILPYYVFAASMCWCALGIFAHVNKGGGGGPGGAPEEIHHNTCLPAACFVLTSTFPLAV